MGSNRTDLHAIHTPVERLFFRVHLLQVQNSPLRKVISSIEQILRNLEPPHTAQAIDDGSLTNVHFLHVHWPSSRSIL